ncbi:MAG: hypothetical protein ACTSQZ_07875, partial [Candidatus Thorarchaeota archaeon]
NIAESTDMNFGRVTRLVVRGIEKGQIPAYLDHDSLELIIDSERVDIDALSRRKGPIMSRDLEDPGAWDMELED